MGPCTNKNDMTTTTFHMESRKIKKIGTLQGQRQDNDGTYKQRAVAAYDEEFVDLGDDMENLDELE